MLTLTRKKNEALIINGNIEVHILDIQKDKVKLGINAPREVKIYREEVYAQVKESNQVASMSNRANFASLKELILNKKEN